MGYTVKNRAGWSSMSPTLTFIAGRLPQPPSKAPELILSSSTQIKFSWIPTHDIGGASKLDNYNIYEGSTLIDTVSPSTLTYTYSTVTAGNSYLISISSVTAIGEGPKSLAKKFWAVDTPTSPTVSVVSTTRDSCKVSWTAVTPPANSLITGYVILIDDGKGGPYRVAYNGVNNPSLLTYNIKNLKP